MDFMYFVYFMCVEIMCAQGNMGEQPVAECFTLYKYTGKKRKKNQYDIYFITQIPVCNSPGQWCSLLDMIFFWKYPNIMNIRT